MTSHTPNSLAPIQSLHEKALKMASHYLRLEKDLLEIIIEIEKRKAFRQLGYNSLYTYVNEGLKLSPATSYNLIQVARKSIEVPELKEEVSSGRLSISKAKKMTAILTKDNHKQWFQVAHQSTHRKLEREVALAHPTQAVPEKSTYVASTEKITEKVQVKQSVPRMALQLGLSEKLMLKIRDVQNLESQRQRKSISLEETLEALTELYLEKKDPVRRAKRQKARGKISSPSLENKAPSAPAHSPQGELGQAPSKEKTDSKKLDELKTQSDPRPCNKGKPGAMAPNGKNKRVPIPASTLHQVYLRDGGQCAYHDHKGRRCSSRRFLEIHHKKPVSLGGGNEIGNLLLTCSGHHKVIHRGGYIGNKTYSP